MRKKREASIYLFIIFVLIMIWFLCNQRLQYANEISSSQYYFPKFLGMKHYALGMISGLLIPCLISILLGKLLGSIFTVHINMRKNIIHYLSYICNALLIGMVFFIIIIGYTDFMSLQFMSGIHFIQEYGYFLSMPYFVIAFLNKQPLLCAQ